MCPRSCARRRKNLTRMTTQLANGVSGTLRSGIEGSDSAPGREYLCQFRRQDNFNLLIRAVARLFVLAPPSELRDVAKPAPLHVIVRNFQNQLRSQRLPREILALAPTTLCPRHATGGFTVHKMLRPM